MIGTYYGSIISFQFFATQSRLEDHERTAHSGEKPFHCQHCEKVK